ncbi:MAG: hypothetical protein M1833_002036 [Piccolia ochrophora]|nr:MAG: hypothetical protein M1833_002036 [Piccolia ochrophora]
MPGLARRLLVIPIADALIVQPVQNRNARGPPPLRITYEDHTITAVQSETTHEVDHSKSLEAYGIVGLLSVTSTSFLVVVSQREQVAQLWGKPVYVITDVAIIPLSSQADAENAIKRTSDSIKKQDKAASEDDQRASDVSDDANDQVVTDEDERHKHDALAPREPDESTITPEGSHPGLPKRRTSVAEDVIGKKGLYGRFADNWFSRRGWSVERRRSQGMSTESQSKFGTKGTAKHSPDGTKEQSEISGTSEIGKASVNEGRQHEDGRQTPTRGVDVDTIETMISTLLPKLIRTTKLLFGSRNFFFSYDYDITRPLISQSGKASDLPLYKTVDPMYFWNRHILSPFIDGQYDSFVLPLMQGFVGQRTFTVEKTTGGLTDDIVEAHQDPSEVIEEQVKLGNPNDARERAQQMKRDLVLTLISRRSVERAGLRYLRRGVDEKGYTANSVETEQLLSDAAWDAERVYSLVQIRGSIPLYFAQSPYSFKPAPVLQHSADINYRAFSKHFNRVAQRYGEIYVASLLDKQGNEAKVGEAYEQATTRLNDNGGIDGSRVGFHWFDFHDACRGMKFENVSLLMDTLGNTLDEFGNTLKFGGKTLSEQSGVLRTNCMDCLDRSNVVQSAVGRRMLEKQIKEEGFDLNLQIDTETQWFNTLWADNGDAISKQYSSTAALKGDFTRTRKRDYKGALNDFGLTLSRYFNNIVNDYFSQAAIDFLLGNVSEQVFEEFEANMMSGDPAMSMAKVRQNAIDTSTKMVIADQTEDLLGGWTFLSPATENTLRTLPFSEHILLLTTTALYRVVFDWALEKVSSFTRVSLRHITSLTYGTYITSTLTAPQTNEARNVGFVVAYRPGTGDIVRINTGALKTGPTEETTLASDEHAKSLLSAPDEPRILAFKALDARSSLAREDSNDDSADRSDTGAGRSPPGQTETDIVRSVCEEIERAALDAGCRVPHPDVKSEFKSEDKPEDNSSDKPAEHDEQHSSAAKTHPLIDEHAIISLAQARKRTGLVERLGFEIKRFVWA